MSKLIRMLMLRRALVKNSIKLELKRLLPDFVFLQKLKKINLYLKDKIINSLNNKALPPPKKLLLIGSENRKS